MGTERQAHPTPAGWRALRQNLPAWQRRVRRACRSLAHKYRSPRLGNPRNPLDDLFFILLSKKTPPDRYARVYRELRRRYWPWRKLLEAKIAELRALLGPLGLSDQRARQFVGIARRLARDFGSVTLTPLRRMTRSAAGEYLVSLPGVGEKSARCVMLYTLGHDVSPVDAHVSRVLCRLGLLPPRATPLEAHRVLDKRMPEGLAYEFHVNTVAHGRETCTARKPRCGRCVVADVCLARETKGSLTLAAR